MSIKNPIKKEKIKFSFESFWYLYNNKMIKQERELYIDKKELYLKQTPAKKTKPQIVKYYFSSVADSSVFFS